VIYLKVVIIGAGSHVFAKNLITDILSYPELRNCTISLVDIDEEALELTTAFAKKLITQHKLETRLESTTDRKTALEGADYIIVSIRVGGLDATRLDIEIPAKYGVKQAIGDTIGPGGVFYALKHIPVLLDALLINYTNPMAMLCWAMNDYSKIKNVGLCHSVQGTAAELARYLGAPLNEISYWVAGINHMAWFLEEKFKDPNVYSRPDAHWAGADIVRVEIFKAFGYFNTESSQHMSEYVPYFRKRPELFERFKLIDPVKRLEVMEERRKKRDELMKQLIQSDEKIPLRRSREYCSAIIHSMETGEPTRINGNVKNEGLITNLPRGCCVEVPCLVDDKTLAFQAILLDPLTSSILTIDETRRMVDEMFEAESKYLPGFK